MDMRGIRGYGLLIEQGLDVAKTLRRLEKAC
jgi:hypothetical protein